MNLKLFFVFAIAIGSWFKFGTLPIWTSGYVNKLGEHTSCVRVIIWIFIDSAPLSLSLSSLRTNLVRYLGMLNKSIKFHSKHFA